MFIAFDHHVQLLNMFDECLVEFQEVCKSSPVTSQSLLFCRQEPVADTVVILADQYLLQLPLEALPLFQHADIKSVTRDFSLQVFCHRLNQGEIPGSTLVVRNVS